MKFIEMKQKVIFFIEFHSLYVAKILRYHYQDTQLSYSLWKKIASMIISKLVSFCTSDQMDIKHALDQFIVDHQKFPRSKYVLNIDFTDPRPLLDTTSPDVKKYMLMLQSTILVHSGYLGQNYIDNHNLYPANGYNIPLTTNGPLMNLQFFMRNKWNVIKST